MCQIRNSECFKCLKIPYKAIYYMVSSQGLRENSAAMSVGSGWRREFWRGRSWQLLIRTLFGHALAGGSSHLWLRSIRFRSPESLSCVRCRLSDVSADGLRVSRERSHAPSPVEIFKNELSRVREKRRRGDIFSGLFEIDTEDHAETI